MMIRAPARAMAAMPAIHAASSARKAAPTTTCPSGLTSTPPLACSDGGIASISESTPNDQPRLRQDRLEVAGDRRLARAGASVEHDHLDRHPATLAAETSP